VIRSHVLALGNRFYLTPGRTSALVPRVTTIGAGCNGAETENKEPNANPTERRFDRSHARPRAQPGTHTFCHLKARPKNSVLLPVLLAGLGLVLAGIDRPAAAVLYNVYDLGGLAGDSNTLALAVNNSGQIVGYSQVGAAKDYVPIFWTNYLSAGFELSQTGATYEADALNNSGQIVGGDTGQSGLATFWTNSASQEFYLDLTGGTRSQAEAINSSGQIVGRYTSLATASDLPAFWTNNGSLLQTLDYLGDANGTGIAHAINDAGQIVGETGPDKNHHATYWTNSSSLAVDLGTLGGSNSAAFSINTVGEIVGEAYDASDLYRAAFWTNGVSPPVQLPSLGIGTNLAVCINNLGQIVGVSATTSNPLNLAAVYWADHNSEPVDLNTLIPTNSGWILLGASGINDSGEIVGFGVITNNGLVQQAHAFALIPVTNADLSLSASAAPEPVGVGSNLVYSLTITNAGPDAATGVVVSNQIPADVTFVSATGGATPSGGVLLLNLGSLAEGATNLVQIAVQPTVAGQLTNLFQVFANEFDPMLMNNSATVVSAVTNAPAGVPFAVTITFPTPGEVLTNQQFFSVMGTVPSSNGVAAVSNVWVQVNNDGWFYASQQYSGDLTNWISYSFGYLVPGTNTVQAYAVDTAGNVSATNTVTFVYVPTAGTQFAGRAPGTPASGFSNPGGSVVAINLGGGIGVQPITTIFETPPITALAGDVVFLKNANNGDNPTNWAAVLRFVNPADPTGTNGLLATEYETYFQTNAAPDYFAGFVLLPNAIFVPITQTNADGSIAGVAVDFGPVGDILGGQEAILDYTAAIQPGADLSLSASAAPEPVGVGSNLVYSITVSNAGPSTATGVVVSNQLPAGVNFVSATGGATPSDGVLLMNLGSLAVGETNLVQIAVQPTVAGQLTNLFQVFANEFDPNVTNNSATVVSVVTNVAVVTAAIPGTGINWTNPGGAVIDTATFVSGGKPLPIQVSNSGIYPASTCQAGDLVMLFTNSASTAPTNWAVVVRFFNPADPTGTERLAATESQAFFATNYGGGGFNGFQLFPVVSYVPVGYIGTDPNGFTIFTTTYTQFGPAAGILAGQTEIATVIGTSFLSLVNITSPTNGQVVSNAALTVTGTATHYFYTNDLTNVMVQLSGGGWISATSVNGWTNWSANVTLAPGSNTVSAYAVDAYGSFSPTNSVTFDYKTNAPVSADLSLSASAVPEPVGVGSNLVYSLTVSNAGPATATGVVVSNQIPAGVNFISATGGATPTNGVLLLNLGSLDTGSNVTAQIVVQPTSAGLLTNLFQVFANEYDPVLTNNSATVVTMITGGATIDFTSESTRTIDTNLTTTVNQQTTNYSTELIAVMPNGTVVYSNAFAIPFSPGALQAAITTAATNLTNAGASAYTGPSETVFTQTLAGTSSVVVTNPIGTNLIITVTTYIGPTNIFVGNNQTNSFTLLPGQEDIDTLVTSVVTNLVTTTSTNTYLASSVYVMTGIVAQVDVALSLMAAPNPVAVGSPLTYSLMVTNNSSTAATGVVVTNTLPPDVTLFSLLPSEGSASNHAGVVTYNVGSLPNGIADTLAIVVIPDAAGLLTNVAVASSAQTDSQPTNNYVTNVTTAVTVPITNLVLTVLSAPVLNPQTGLFEQQIEVSNGGPSTPSSVLVLVSGLAANARLYNATGITNGLPFVQSALPLGIGSNVVFVLEFYVPTRVAPTGLTYLVEAGPPFVPPVVNGTILNISRTIVLSNGSVLVEFSAIPGQVYAIQYSSDMVTWQTAVPVITAPANRVQWIDAGPPQTDSSPAQQPSRFYRVVLLPAH